MELQQLRAQAAAGEIELAYVDEAGFAQVHPNRSAWTPVGQQHAIEGQRGARLNVLGALLSSGKAFFATLWQTVTAELFAGFLGLLREHTGSDRPLVVVVDNASIHTAKAIAPYLWYLAKQGVRLHFLPAYSPELNRIEVLWRLVKHRWMQPKRRDKEELEAEVSSILQAVGTKFHLAF